MWEELFDLLHFACEAVPVDENGLEMYKITKEDYDKL